MIMSDTNFYYTPNILHIFCFFSAKEAKNIIAQATITPWHCHLGIDCAQLYKCYIFLFKYAGKQTNISDIEPTA